MIQTTKQLQERVLSRLTLESNGKAALDTILSMCFFFPIKMLCSQSYVSFNIE